MNEIHCREIRGGVRGIPSYSKGKKKKEFFKMRVQKPNKKKRRKKSIFRKITDKDGGPVKGEKYGKHGKVRKPGTGVEIQFQHWSLKRKKIRTNALTITPEIQSRLIMVLKVSHANPDHMEGIQDYTKGDEDEGTQRY